MRDSLPDDVVQNIRKIKQMTNTPIAVGFGVSTPAQAKLIGKTADGVIVGSAIVKEIERHAKDAREVVLRSVGAFVGELILGAKG